MPQEAPQLLPPFLGSCLSIPLAHIRTWMPCREFTRESTVTITSRLCYPIFHRIALCPSVCRVAFFATVAALSSSRSLYMFFRYLEIRDLSRSKSGAIGFRDNPAVFCSTFITMEVSPLLVWKLNGSSVCIEVGLRVKEWFVGVAVVGIGFIFHLPAQVAAPDYASCAL